MSLDTPTTQGTADAIVAQIEGSIGQSVPLLPKSFTRVLAKALAGVVVLLYKYAGFIFLQMFVATATYRETTVNGRVIRPLLELGRQMGVPDPIAAVRAELVLTVTVRTQTGSLPANTQFVRSQTGVVYLSLTSVALDAATVSVTVRASADPSGTGGAGIIGNLPNTSELQVVSPPATIVPIAVVAGTSVVGVDAEEIETSYRPRVVARGQARPQGGAYADYREWALGVAGIIAAYPYTGDPGEVDVYVEATIASSGSADGIPTAPQLAAVATAFELTSAGTSGKATRRPVTAAPNALPITRTAFDVRVNGLDIEDVAGAEAAITTALDEYLRSREPFIVGLSVLPRRDRVTQAAVAGVVDSVASALGASVANVTLELIAVPTIAYTLGAGEKAKLNTAIFV